MFGNTVNAGSCSGSFSAMYVCNKILQQAPRLKDIGPTVDYVKMMINIASFEFVTKRDDTKYKNIFTIKKHLLNNLVTLDENLTLKKPIRNVLALNSITT